MLQVRLIAMDAADPSFGPYLADRFSVSLPGPHPVVELCKGTATHHITLANANYAIISESVSPRLTSSAVAPVVGSADALADNDFHTSPVTEVLAP